MAFPRITRKRFHTLRLALWSVQIPIAITTPLKTSVAYLVFLSIAALVESAGTDFDQARRDEKLKAAGVTDADI